MLRPQSAVVAALFFVAVCAGCATGKKGPSILEGNASWYGPNFKGRPTASGEKFKPGKLTAAHKTLPLGTVARVTNLKNGKSVTVRINDRGPFVEGRILDLSRGAAKKIDMIKDGVVPVRIKILKRGP